MFRGFVEKSYTEFTKKQIYLRPSFQSLVNRGNIILDEDLVDQVYWLNNLAEWLCSSKHK
jgi:hypothetical protein